DRLVVALAGEVPERDVQWPRPPGVEADVGEHRGVTLEVERVLAQEVLLVVGEAVHGIARADAHPPRVVEHPHDRRRKVGARTRIPCRGKRRIQGESVMADLDAADPAHGPAAPSPRSSSQISTVASASFIRSCSSAMRQLLKYIGWFSSATR